MLQFDVVTCALSGDYGKPRPCVVMQNTRFNELHSSIVVCPITSHIEKEIVFRPTLLPEPGNGLEKLSQVMVDKIMTVKKDKVGQVLGHLSSQKQDEIIFALKLWFDI